MKHVYFAHDRQDSPDDRKSYLELTGYQVTLFTSAHEILQACRDEPPELVLLDALLPGKNGFHTARELRDVVGAGVPIVLCSRIYTADAFREEAANVGCDGFLSLPVQMGEFLACVQTVTAAARQRTELDEAA